MTEKTCNPAAALRLNYKLNVDMHHVGQNACVRRVLSNMRRST